MSKPKENNSFAQVESWVLTMLLGRTGEYTAMERQALSHLGIPEGDLTLAKAYGGREARD